MKKFLFAFITLILVSGLILSGCSNQTTTAPSTTSATTPAGTIKIGVIASTSGFFAGMAQYQVPGAQLAINKVNAAGGVLGRQVEMVLRDDQGDPSVVPQKAADLKSQGVVGIVGSFLDNVQAALFQWGNDNKVLISGCSDTEIVNRTTKFSKYVFFAGPVNLATSNVFFKEISKQDDVKSIYFLAGDVVVAHDIYDSFWASMAKSKPSVTNLGSTFVGMQEMEFSSIINSILSKNPSMIVSGLGGPQWPAFVKQAVQFGLFQKTKLTVIYGLDASTSFPLGKDTPEGIQGVIYCPFFLDTPEMKAFQADYAAMVKGQYVNDLTVQFYNATLGLLEAIKAAGSTDPDKVIPVWEKLTLNTPLGTVSYHDYDHQLEVPIWFGTSTNSPDYPIVIVKNLVKYQQGIYPTKDEILAMRGTK